MILVLLSGNKRKVQLGKTNNVKINDKSKTYILRGERNASYNETFLSNSKEIQQELLKPTFIFTFAANPSETSCIHPLN